MRKNKIDDIVKGIGPEGKRGILNHLISALTSTLNEQEKKEMIGAVLSGRMEGKQLESMVER